MIRVKKYDISKPLSQSVAHKVTANTHKEESHAEGIHHPCSPEGSVITYVFEYETTGHDAKTDARIPHGELGRIGSTALIVRRIVDEHSLKRRPHVTVAEAYNQGRAVIPPRIMDSRKQKVAEHAQKHTAAGILKSLTLAQATGAYDARHH